MRTGGLTSDHIGPQFGSSSDRFLWVEYAQFRPNIPLDPTGQQAKPRLQKKASALQEYWEQLMVCKCGFCNEAACACACACAARVMLGAEWLLCRLCA